MRVWRRYSDVVLANWHLGFTAFGGPAVQFQTVRFDFEKPLPICISTLLTLGKFHRIFVEDLGWIDEAMVSLYLILIWSFDADGMR